VFLLIFESIGTSELILIGVIALIFLGPRKMPEYAKKIGKLMADFRSTTNEFKETWEREVNFDEEAKAFRIDDEPPAFPVSRVPSIDTKTKSDELPAPSVTEADPGRFADAPTADIPASESAEQEEATMAGDDVINDKKNWL
jgi:sec-independent protein translocase protein TatB